MAKKPLSLSSQQLLEYIRHPEDAPKPSSESLDILNNSSTEQENIEWPLSSENIAVVDEPILLDTPVNTPTENSGGGAPELFADTMAEIAPKKPIFDERLVDIAAADALAKTRSYATPHITPSGTQSGTQPNYDAEEKAPTVLELSTERDSFSAAAKLSAEEVELARQRIGLESASSKSASGTTFGNTLGKSVQEESAFAEPEPAKIGAFSHTSTASTQPHFPNTSKRPSFFVLPKAGELGAAYFGNSIVHDGENSEPTRELFAVRQKAEEQERIADEAEFAHFVASVENTQTHNKELGDVLAEKMQVAGPAGAFASAYENLSGQLDEEDASHHALSKRLSKLILSLANLGQNEAEWVLGVTLLPEFCVCALCHVIGRRRRINDVQCFALEGESQADNAALLQKRILEMLPQEAVQGEEFPAVWREATDKEAHLFFFTVPKVKENELEIVARARAKKESAFDDADTLFDYRVLAEYAEAKNTRQSVLAASMASLTAENYRLDMGGLTLSGLTAPRVSLFNYFASGWLKCPWERFVLVVLEQDEAQISFFSNKDWPVRRTIRTSIQVMVQDLESQLRRGVGGVCASLFDGLENLEKPEKMRRAAEKLLYSPKPSQSDCNLLSEVLEPVFVRLTRQVERTLAFFKINFAQGGEIQGVLLSAPAGCSPILQEFFSRSFSLPCLPFTLDGRSDCAVKIDDLLNSPKRDALIQCVGLSLSDSTTMNFLLPTQERRKKRLQRKVKNYITLGMALVLAFVVGLCGMNLAELQQLRVDIAQEKAPQRVWHEKYSESALQKRLEKVRGFSVEARKLAARRLPAALLYELSESVGEEVFLHHVRLVKTKSIEKRAAGAKASTKKTVQSLHLSGTVYGKPLEQEIRLAQFFDRLEQSSLVESIAIPQKTDFEGGMSFILTARLR